MHSPAVGTLAMPDWGALLFPLAATDIIRECWAMAELGDVCLLVLQRVSIIIIFVMAQMMFWAFRLANNHYKSCLVARTSLTFADIFACPTEKSFPWC